MKYYALLLPIFFWLNTHAQSSKRTDQNQRPKNRPANPYVKPTDPDSSFTIPMITASYARQFTGNDIANRFGSNNNVGGSFAIKTKTNWYYGFKGNFLWGGDVKEVSILDNIKTSDDAVIDSEGRLTDIFLGQRGSSLFLIGGRMFNVFAPNKNSGILVYGGLGTLHHKISIKFKDDVVQLSDEHKKGYDRLSFGYAVNGFVGYMYLSKSRLVNFFGGIDITQGWTKSLRKYNFDTQESDTEVKSDFLYGLRLGWIIRFGKRESESFYYD